MARSGATLLLALLLVAGVLFQVSRVSGQPLNDTDFRYVWMAGNLWWAQGNPYSACFIDNSVGVFGPDAPLSVWVYPFQWFWIATPLSLLTPAAALRLWQVASILLTLVGALLAVRSAARLGVQATSAAMLALGVFAATFSPLGAMLQLGQPVIMPTFGFALLLSGMAMGSSASKLAGIMLLALKPQFGLPILLMIATDRRHLRLCVIGGVATLLLAIPPLLIGGAARQVAGLIGNISGGYDSVPVNQPFAMVGLPSLLANATGVNLSVSIGLALSAMLSVAIGFALNRSTSLTPQQKVVYLAAFGALMVTFVVGIHPSDLGILLIVMPLMFLQRPLCRVINILGYLVLWRFENVTRLFELPGVLPSITLASLGVALIGSSWTIDIILRSRAVPDAPAGPRHAG